MKKTFFLVAFIICAVIVKSQPVNVQSAYNYFNKQKYDKAKEAIDLAALDAKTSTWGKTWYYRGNIYLNICISSDPKIKSLDSNALQVAYDSYQNAIKYDEKKEFTNEIMGQLMVCSEQYYNRGVEFFNKKLYNKSLAYFEKTVNINLLFSKTDADAMYYAALSADYLNQSDAAKKYYKKLYDLNYKNLATYFAMQRFYKKNKDTAKAMEAIQKGLTLYPDILKNQMAQFEKKKDPEKEKKTKDMLELQNLNLLIEETNIYIAKGQNDKAQENLLKAIKKDSTNPNLYYSIGGIYDKIYYDTTKTMPERLKAYNQAEKKYKDAIALKPDYFDANYNLGALYFNESVRILEAADRIKDENAYNIEKAKVEALWQKALPYLEKAIKVQPNDQNTLISLKQIYARTKQYDKAKEMNQRLEDLKQKK